MREIPVEELAAAAEEAVTKFRGKLSRDGLLNSIIDALEGGLRKENLHRFYYIDEDGMPAFYFLQIFRNREARRALITARNNGFLPHVYDQIMMCFVFISKACKESYTPEAVPEACRGYLDQLKKLLEDHQCADPIAALKEFKA